MSTVITIGLYCSACISEDRRFLLASTVSSLLAFFTTALYLNELTNSSGNVSVTTRFTGTYAFAMINPEGLKSIEITSSSRQSMDPHIYIYSGLIFTVSYAIFINFMHIVFSMVYVFRHKENASNSNCCPCSWNSSKPGDTARIVGIFFAGTAIILACFQSIFSLVIGFIIPSYFTDTFPFTIFVCFIALNPPVIKLPSIERDGENDALVANGQKPAYKTTNQIPFAIYLTFLVLGCFYTIANYTIDGSWRVYNDVGVMWETNSTKIFRKEFKYLIQNSSYAGETVTYTPISDSIVGLTTGFYCTDGVFSLIILICILITTLSHFAMLKYICD